MSQSEASAVTGNLRSYFGYLSEHIGNPVQKMEGGHVTLSADLQDPSFNFVFTDDTITKYEVFERLYGYLENELKTKATWVLRPGMKQVSSWLLERGLDNISKPKRMVLNISNYIFPQLSEKTMDCELEIIKTEDELMEFDSICAKCFSHAPKIAYDLFKGFFAQKELKFRVMLLKRGGRVCGGCIMYVDGNCAGFYADGVLPPYRKSGLGSFMIVKRIEMAKALNCKYAIAQCFPMSVNMYERCGFRNVGNLVLQSDH